jgi:hypothetical protein
MEHQTGPEGAEPSGQDWIEDGGTGLAWLRSFTEPDEETALDEEAGPDEETALVEETALDEEAALSEETALVEETALDDSETREDLTVLTGAETALLEDDTSPAGSESADWTAGEAAAGAEITEAQITEAQTAYAEAAETRVAPRAADAGSPEAATSSGPAASQVPAEPVPETGEPRVDAALRLLERLPGLPVSDHPELFEQVHAQLAEVLSDLGSGLPGGPADPPRS